MDDPVKLHDRAMDTVDRADYEFRRGNVAEATLLREQSLGLAVRAALGAINAHLPEPTRSVLLRSAASLAVECRDQRVAKSLIGAGLAGNPPTEIAAELRELRAELDRQTAEQGASDAESQEDMNPTKQFGDEVPQRIPALVAHAADTSPDEVRILWTQALAQKGIVSAAWPGPDQVVNRSSLLASVLADPVRAQAMAPLPCPSDFGPTGRYRLESLIGAGDGSLIYRATDKLLSVGGFKANVAIKIYRSERRAQRDALLASRIRHPNVLQVLDRGIGDNGCLYVVTELAEGGNLDETETALSERQAAIIAAKISSAIHAVHAAGVVHCDLKPSNVLLTSEGEPKIADFDLAQWSVVADHTPRGNLAFMSPEQMRGEENALTPQSDVYALGGLLYYLLTARLPNGETASEISRVRDGMALERSLEVDRDLGLICQRAMAADRHERYLTAAELRADLDRWLDMRPIDWTRPGPFRIVYLWVRRQPVLASALVLAALLFIGVVLAMTWILLAPIQMR